jgi:hypothetical protein
VGFGSADHNEDHETGVVVITVDEPKYWTQEELNAAQQEADRLFKLLNKL